MGVVNSTPVLLELEPVFFVPEMKIKSLIVYGDSLLVIKQMNNQYKVSSENLIPLFTEAQELKKKFDTILFVHVYRTQNKRADELSNLGLCLDK